MFSVAALLLSLIFWWHLNFVEVGIIDNVVLILWLKNSLTGDIPVLLCGIAWYANRSLCTSCHESFCSTTAVWFSLWSFFAKPSLLGCSGIYDNVNIHKCPYHCSWMKARCHFWFLMVFPMSMVEQLLLLLPPGVLIVFVNKDKEIILSGNRSLEIKCSQGLSGNGVCLSGSYCEDGAKTWQAMQHCTTDWPSYPFLES